MHSQCPQGSLCTAADTQLLLKGVRCASDTASSTNAGSTQQSRPLPSER